MTTGDGIVSALHVLKLMKKKNATLQQLADFMYEYPQKLVSLPVKERIPLENHDGMNRLLAAAKADMGELGRVFVRYSGTENKLRVLTEARTVEMVEKWNNAICDLIREELS